MIRLAVRCSPDQAELVLAELVQICPGGVEEEHGPGWVEYAIYGAEGELPDLGSLQAAVADGMVDVRSEPIPDDWADRWRDFHEPTLIADRVLIRPSWSDAPLKGAIDVVIDPGQAFGTGAHPTTRMCVELLVALADQGEAHGALVDLGTGSGVLAITAARLGWAPVRGIDLEPAALEAARDNAEANDVAIELERFNLREEAAPVEPTVIANLTAPILVNVAALLPEAPRRMICSGLLTREVAQVMSAFAAAGLGTREHRDSGDWSALLLDRC